MLLRTYYTYVNVLHTNKKKAYVFYVITYLFTYLPPVNNCCERSLHNGWMCTRLHEVIGIESFLIFPENVLYIF